MERGCITYADGPLEVSPSEAAEHQTYLQHVQKITVVDTGKRACSRVPALVQGHYQDVMIPRINRVRLTDGS